MMKKTTVTTIDNPHDPFDDYIAWFNYDVSSGYYTAAMLGRIAKLSDQLSDADYHVAVEKAVDEIVKENVSGIYVKVEREIVDQNV
jgi:hypothetical protein